LLTQKRPRIRFSACPHQSCQANENALATNTESLGRIRARRLYLPVCCALRGNSVWPANIRKGSSHRRPQHGGAVTGFQRVRDIVSHPGLAPGHQPYPPGDPNLRRVFYWSHAPDALVERRLSSSSRTFARRAREMRSRRRYPARKPNGRPMKTAIAKSNIVAPLGNAGAGYASLTDLTLQHLTREWHGAFSPMHLWIDTFGILAINRG